MNIYVLLAGILLACGLAGSGYYVGKQVAEGEAATAREEAEQGFKKLIDAADGRATKAAEDAAAAAIKLDTAERVQTKEVNHYESTPAAAVACLDADGLHAWNGDATAGADPVQPVGHEPGPGEPIHAQ